MTNLREKLAEIIKDVVLSGMHSTTSCGRSLELKAADVIIAAGLVPQWQPIETAPKEVEVLVWSAVWNVPYLIKATLENHGWRAGGFDISNPNQPTHWMPSPATPAIGVQGETA